METVIPKIRRYVELNASITVESSLVFPIVLLIMIAVIKLSFAIYDSTVGNMLSIYQKNKANEASWGYYDVEQKLVDINALINRPILGYDTNFCDRQNERIYQEVSHYAKNISAENIGINYLENDTRLKNSMIVRWSQILIDRGGLWEND